MNSRRFDLDWLRVLVFALLIVYHVGMFFVPWDWHIKNNEISDSLQIPMLFLNQWRLPLLFLISGMGTRMALSRRNWAGFVKERISRLLIPLLVGMIFIIAPQVYVERMVSGEFSGSFWQFYSHHYFTQGIYPTGNFSWHHLWFIPYLLIYSLVLSPVFIYWRNHPQNNFIMNAKKLWLKSYGPLVYLIPLLTVKIILEPSFPITHALVGDYYFLLLNMIYFLYGYLFICMGDEFWLVIYKVKKITLYLGVILFAAFIILSNQHQNLISDITLELSRFINVGCWIVTIFGYAAKYLNKPGNLVSNLNQAVYPFYIVHQTVIILLAYTIYDSSLSIGIKFFYLTAFTFLISWVLYKFLLQFRLTRMAFGIKAKKPAGTFYPIKVSA